MSRGLLSLTGVAVIGAAIAVLAYEYYPQAPALKDAITATAPMVERMRTRIADAEAQALQAARSRPEAMKLWMALSELPTELIDFNAIEKSTIPVIALARQDLVDRLRMFAATNHFTASTRQGRTLIEVDGTSLVALAPANFQLPDISKPSEAIQQMLNGVTQVVADIAQRIKGMGLSMTDAVQNIVIDRTEYGIDISFTRYGAVYNLTLDCNGQNAAPPAAGSQPAAAQSVTVSGDLACTVQNALKLIDDLEVVGGGDHAPSAPAPSPVPPSPAQAPPVALPSPSPAPSEPPVLAPAQTAENVPPVPPPPVPPVDVTPTPAPLPAPVPATPPGDSTAASSPPAPVPVPVDPPKPCPADAPAAPPPAATLTAFTYEPPGKLVNLPTASGNGILDKTIWAPGIRFPLEVAPAYANSQVWGAGGMSGPKNPDGSFGSQCDPRNYSYPWHDNFCESRSYTTVLCPAGAGHQGQDIRPATCKKAAYKAVAAEEGDITQIGSYTVYLTADDGRLYRYLHMQMDQLSVKVGDHVCRGQPLGLVSNNFGGTPTTIHLHFEIKMAVSRNGLTAYTWVPPYSSLVDAYQRLLAGKP